jgi:hypothetical protein
MLNRTKFEDLRPELVEPLEETNSIVRAYLQGLSFIIGDTSRDPRYAENHLLYYLSQDLLQSALSVTSLAMEGMISVAKRELRFILESSIKLCFVQQKDYKSSVAEKLITFEKELSSQRISIKENIALDMIPENLRAEFTVEVGRIYGSVSKYVHLTPLQIQERIWSMTDGRTVGNESADEILQLNDLTARTLAASLVLIFHSVPDWVAGDWLVEQDGDTIDWYFTASRFIAGMDSFFDYKFERQDRLQTIMAARDANVSF